MARNGIVWTVLVCFSFSAEVVDSICNVNSCTKNRTPFIPLTCSEYTDYLKCVKQEYDSCTNDAGRSQVMMGIYYSGGIGDDNNVAFCGYDLTQIQNMMTARAGLMMSVFNSSIHNVHMMGNEGPLDDGPFDDNPYDDDDDGPFDDGPFDDLDDNRMVHPGLVNPNSNGGHVNPNQNGGSQMNQQPNRGSGKPPRQQPAPPPAPRVRPVARGGAARQVDDKNSVKGIRSHGLLVLYCLSCLFIFMRE